MMDVDNPPILYPHLNEDTKRLLSGTLDERVAWVHLPHFIFFDSMRKLYEKIEQIFERVAATQTFNELDLQNIESTAILGDTGSGKTTFCRYFLQQIGRASSRARVYISVVAVS